MTKIKPLYIIGGAVVIIAGLAIWHAATPGKLDAFTQCLTEQKVTFYGAFWCPHCQAQKQLFGKSAKSLPYVECSTPDGQGVTQVCKDAGIQSYPTWQFADGSRTSGEQTLQALAEKSGCTLP